MKVDNTDRFLAATLTVMVIIVTLAIGYGIIAAFVAAPIGTLVLVSLVSWLFYKIYPRIIDLMEKGDL